jgi:hypothetical protein
MIMQMMQKIRLSQRVDSDTRAAAIDPVAVVIASSPNYPSRTEDAPLFRAAMPRLFVVGLFCQLQNSSSVWNCTPSKPTLETRKKVNSGIYFVFPAGISAAGIQRCGATSKHMFSADPHCFVVLQGECIFAIQGCTRLDQERRIRRHDPSPIFWKNGYVFSEEH